jgi:Na+/glutamate symporter
LWLPDVLGAVDWNAVGALATVVLLAGGVVGAAVTRAVRWRERREAEHTTDERVWTALFGRDAKSPYPAVAGLVAEHASTAKAVQELGRRVETVETGMAQIEGAVATLLKRTEANGGGSIKDDLNAIKEHLGIG